jgi:uncharacterized protein (DUF1800 family)
MKLINNSRMAITLQGGVILAAAGTPGSSKEVDALNEVDRRRHVETGRIAIAPEAVEEVPVKMVATRIGDIVSRKDAEDLDDAKAEGQPQRAQGSRRTAAEKETTK